MNATSYRFKIGTFECIVVSDGTHVYEQPAPLLFANAPQEQLERALREHGVDLATWTEWPSPYSCLVINTGDHQVLVDTGAGGSIPVTGLLIPNLRTAGIAPEDVDTVIYQESPGTRLPFPLAGPGTRRPAGGRLAVAAD